MNTDVFRNLSYGVYVVSTMDNGRATGCTANSAVQITASPATVAVLPAFFPSPAMHLWSRFLK